MISVYEAMYKDVFAVCVETDKVCAYFLPKNGCKLASFIDKGTGYELMAQVKSDHYLSQTIVGNYVDNEVSAFDDMFPTIDEMVSASGLRKGVIYPCHGEVCRVEHSYIVDNDVLETTFTSSSLLYTYTKYITATEIGAIEINYEIKNNSDEEFHCLWGAHFMIAAEEGGYGVVPYDENAKVEIMFDGNSEFGNSGDVLPLSEDMLTSKKHNPNGNTLKYYFAKKNPCGSCGYYNPEIGKTITLNYDNNMIPYLGVWKNDGLFKNLYNFTLEPCTAPYDSPNNAENRGVEFTIGANETINFKLVIDVC